MKLSPEWQFRVLVIKMLTLIIQTLPWQLIESAEALQTARKTLQQVDNWLDEVEEIKRKGE